jgi:hypothetical protein
VSYRLIDSLRHSSTLDPRLLLDTMTLITTLTLLIMLSTIL